LDPHRQRGRLAQGDGADARPHAGRVCLAGADGGQGAGSAPFVDAPGGVQFRSLPGQVTAQPGDPLPMTVDGAAAFLTSPTGNGVFVTAPASGNGPGAWINSGRVVDPATGATREVRVTAKVQERFAAAARAERDRRNDALGKSRADVIEGQCPLWLEMVAQAFAPLGPDLQLDSVRNFQEWCGAAVLGLATRYHRALVMQGKPGSGKSEIIRVVKALVTGHVEEPDAAHEDPRWAHFLSAVELSQWDDSNMVEKFTRARLNCAAEISREAVKEPGRILTIINGESLTIRSVYERAFTFKPRTAHLFATNDLPSVNAGDEFWDRFLLLRLPQRVRGTSRQIEYYGHHVAVRELPGIVAWALEGAARLRARGRYELGGIYDDLREHWRDEANPVAEWAAEALVQQIDGFIEANELRRVYLHWAQGRGYSDQMNEKTFTTRLAQVGHSRRKHITTRR
jgi:phage/plasmid-associated DNA primase